MKRTIKRSVLLLLAIGTAVLFTGCSMNTYSERKELDAAALAELHIHAGSGEVVVYPTTETPYAELFVKEGGLRLKKAEMKLSQSGQRTDIALEGGVFGSGYLDMRLEIYLPKDAVKDFYSEVASGDFLCRGFTFETLSGQLSSGDMRFDQVNARQMDFTVASGELDLSRVNAGQAAFHLSSGDIEADFDGEVERLFSQVSSGDIEITGAFDQIEASASSGDTKINSAIVPQSLSCDVTSGYLEIETPEDAAGFTARYQAQSGNFHSDFASGLDAKKGSFTIGAGQGQFDFSLASGEIYLKKRG